MKWGKLFLECVTSLQNANKDAGDKWKEKALCRKIPLTPPYPGIDSPEILVSGIIRAFFCRAGG